MKRLVLSLLGVLILAINAHAGCKFKQDTIGFTDWEHAMRFRNVALVAGFESEQTMGMLLKFVADGFAINIPEGTEVKKSPGVPDDYIDWATVNGVRVIVPYSMIQCDK